MRATMIVLAQLSRSVMPLMPPVHLTPRRSVRSSTRVAMRGSAIIGAMAAAASYAISEDPLKRICVVLAHLLALEIVPHASSRGIAEALAKSRVGEQKANGRRQSGGIVRFDEDAVLPVIDDLQNAVDGRSHDCFAAGHRFQRGDSKTLKARRQHEDRTLVQELLDRRARLLADQVDLLFQAELRDQTLELR